MNIYGGGMVWNIMDKTDATADGIKLPEMHIKPYIKYGVGVQKTVGDRFTGFLQAMVRNGGRNGVVLSMGFRWTIGKDKKTPKNSDKKSSANSKTVVKSL